MSRTQRELKALRQQQREEAQRRQQARERRNLIVIAAGVVLTGVAILLIAVFLNHQQNPTNAQHIAFAAYSGPAPGTLVADEGTPSHIDPSTVWPYKNYPPTSGPHYGQPNGPAPWQTIDTQLSEGTFIHNLEHGGIVILYNCGSGSDCSSLKSSIDDYVQNRVPADPRFGAYKVIAAPYTRNMSHKVALLAWHYIQWVDAYDQNAITKFYEAHVNQGPEKVP